jgi:hypothetical protein
MKEYQKLKYLLSSIFLVVALIVFYNKNNFNYYTSFFLLIIFFLFVSKFFNKLIYNFWILISNLISSITSRIFLFGTFYLIFTPIGLYFRIFNMFNSKLKIDSYWQKSNKKEINIQYFKRQF